MALPNLRLVARPLFSKHFSSVSQLPAYFQKPRACHSKSPLSEDCIVVADNGSTIVCWHPEPKFPYECSLPLPLPKETHPVLKVSWKDVEESFHQQKPEFQREYLMKLTHTTKHRWFPRPERRFAKKTKPDREYL